MTKTGKNIEKNRIDNWKEVETQCRETLTPEIADYIRSCRQGAHSESALISVLHRVQKHFGYLGAAQLDAVAQLLQVPAAKVSGVATFYHFFRLSPRGRFIISICMGTACYVKGAEQIVQRLKDELGIDFGQTTSDGLFTLEGTRCLGTCGLAPVIMVNEEVHGKLTPDRIPALLEEYVKKARQEDRAKQDD